MTVGMRLKEVEESSYEVVILIERIFKVAKTVIEIRMGSKF